jgi:tetratricopeptide (TPR) repeat protein
MPMPNIHTRNETRASPKDGQGAAADRPGQAQVLNRSGIGRLQTGDCAGALDDFRQAALLQPDYPEPWNNSGLVRQLLGQLTGAVADFDRALALRPDYAEALINRGRTRQLLGDPAAALEDFDRALELAVATPFAASVLHNRGVLRQEHGDPAGARADFDRALAIDPGHTATYVSRGNLRKEAGDLPGALADFEQALAQNPSQGLAAVYHGRGGVRVLLNDFKGAVADYDRALGQEPERFHLYLSRANARYHLRDPGCIADFRTAFRLDPQGAAHGLLRILLLDAQRDAQGVLDNCSKHLRINTNDISARARRGLTLLLLGRDAEAAPDLALARDAFADEVPRWEQVVALARRSRSRAACPAAAGSPIPVASAADALFAAYR